MQNYPNNLRELRKVKGMLQIEVAQLLGHLNSDRVSDWEKGYAMPSVANLFKLARVLGVTTENLYPEIGATAVQEVEEKRVSLQNENEWVRRMRLRDAVKARASDQTSYDVACSSTL
jgi:transcriptional regulator with XRE-family HTH domain